MTESPIAAQPYITRELQKLRVGAQVVQSAQGSARWSTRS
jgi:hypothetical protein